MSRYRVPGELPAVQPETTMPRPVIKNGHYTPTEGHAEAFMPPGTAVRSKEIHKLTIKTEENPLGSGRFQALERTNAFLDIAVFHYIDETAKAEITAAGIPDASDLDALKEQMEVLEEQGGVFKQTGRMLLFRTKTPEGPATLQAHLLDYMADYERNPRALFATLKNLGKSVMITDEGVLDPKNPEPLSLAEIQPLDETTITRIPFKIAEAHPHDDNQERYRIIPWEAPVSEDEDPGIPAGRIIIDPIVLDHKGSIDYSEMGVTIECYSEDGLLAGLLVNTSGVLRAFQLERQLRQEQAGLTVIEEAVIPEVEEPDNVVRGRFKAETA